MPATARSAVLPLLLAAVVLLITAGCPKPKPKVTPDLPIPGEGNPSRIEVPAPDARLPAQVYPAALDELSRRLGGPVKANFPAYDGDPFFVSLPVRQVDRLTAGEVLETIVEPVLAAIGFEGGTRRLSKPPEEGVEMARADLSALAQAVADEYRASPELARPKTQTMIDALLGRTEVSDELDQALRMGEGMSFSQFVAGVERLEIQFPFQQLEEGVPVEHTLLLAARWEGQGITTVRGVLFNEVVVDNAVEIDLKKVIEAAVSAVRGVDGVTAVTSRQPTDGPHHVLLPFGTDGRGRTLLRHAYRMTLSVVWNRQEGPFLLWLDAEDGRLLKLEPLIHDAVNARGEAWNREPGIGTKTVFFRVDEAVDDEYTLQLTGAFNRLDYLDDGYDAMDVSIDDDTNGSSATLANFAQAPIDDETEALCASGSNKAYQQVHMFSHLVRYRDRALALGIPTPYPSSPLTPRVESASAGCNAYGGLNFGACAGYYDAGCPNTSDGTTASANLLNTAHDNTWIAHELGHTITPRFTNARPADWCGAIVCAIPVGWSTLHDLCDAWSAHFESTNCWSGWFAKNLGGVNASLNCLSHNENGYTPRLHEVSVPFNPAAPGDHFPEHRAVASGVYADMQIAAAALWQVRLGMRSKCRPSGLPQYGVRFARALYGTGFFGVAPGDSDTGIYRYLHDLELEMVEQWANAGSPAGPPAFAHNGAHTTNKVTAGFASAGLFLIPYQCLDGDPATGDPTACPLADGGENGGDAAIDVDDDDPDDDLSIHGVDHPEVDFLELGGPPPIFHVWTGPRYRLDGAGGGATFTSPAPCNPQFRVSVSTDPDFPPGATFNSPWIDVDTDPTTAGSAECYGTWSPNPGQWMNLQSDGALTRIYYRATTRVSGGVNERTSTEPGNGLWTVPPPYAVITADGRSDY